MEARAKATYFTGRWCNGSTADFGSVCPGSNPGRPVFVIVAAALRMSGADAQPIAIILAAGKGTRMKGELPKVVYPVGGRPMVCAVVDACREAGCGRIVVVVGYRQDLVREALAGQPGVEFAVQDRQLGTGHAVLCAQDVVGD